MVEVTHLKIGSYSLTKNANFWDIAISTPGGCMSLAAKVYNCSVPIMLSKLNAGFEVRLFAPEERAVIRGEIYMYDHSLGFVELCIYPMWGRYEVFGVGKEWTCYERDLLNMMKRSIPIPTGEVGSSIRLDHIIEELSGPILEQVTKKLRG